MSRGKLDKETAARVEKGLPDVTEVRKATLSLQPDFISMGFPPGSTIPIAAVCLQDVTSTLQEVRYALVESLAHIVWYREKSEPPNEHLAVFFGRFYADDAALRLYAAGEHLAKAIICTLEISNSDLKKYKRTSRPDDQGSEQSAVGKYLKAERLNHPVTKAILKLIRQDEWFQTINYRNEWVHSKPPIVEGQGIEYERRNRLEVSTTHIGIRFGGGDAPKYSVDGLLGFIKPALSSFTETVIEIVEYYVEYLNKNQKRDW